MRHEADLVNGPLYDYLGHFGRYEYLCQGHNDTPTPATRDSYMDNINRLGQEPDVRETMRSDPVGTARTMSNLSRALRGVHPGLGGAQ